MVIQCTVFAARARERGAGSPAVAAVAAADSAVAPQPSERGLADGPSTASMRFSAQPAERAGQPLRRPDGAEPASARARAQAKEAGEPERAADAPGEARLDPAAPGDGAAVLLELPLPRPLAEAHFARRLRSIMRACEDLGVGVSAWSDALRTGNAVALARRHIADKNAVGQTDWRLLGSLNRLDLSVEFAVCDAECCGLFGDAERELARQRLIAAQPRRSRRRRAGQSGRGRRFRRRPNR